MTRRRRDARAVRQLRAGADPLPGGGGPPRCASAHAYEDLMQQLEAGDGELERDVEFLPSTEEMAERRGAGEGLVRPELAVLVAYAKRAVFAALVASDLPDSPYLAQDLRSYFPSKIVERFGSLLDEHPLRRDLIASIVANDVVNGAGMTLAAARGRDRRLRRRAHPCQLRGPRDRRVAAAARGDQVLRQPARRRRADAHAHRDAHPRRTGLPLAGQHPPSTARLRRAGGSSSRVRCRRRWRDCPS